MAVKKTTRKKKSTGTSGLTKYRNFIKTKTKTAEAKVKKAEAALKVAKKEKAAATKKAAAAWKKANK